MPPTTIPTEFCQYSQQQALSIFPSLLRDHLPHSTPIYTRILSPLNTPERRCLFAATFPPTACQDVPANYTILFADRSRHLESQVWLFNPIVAKASLLSEEEEQIPILVEQILKYVKSVDTAQGLSRPFSPELKLASIHEIFAVPLQQLASQRKAEIYGSLWNQWLIDLSRISSLVRPRDDEFQGWQVSRVPEEELDKVIANSAIRRQKETLKRQASACLLNEKGEMIAWAFIGLDGSLCTLHVMTEFRGKGLAKRVSLELLSQYAKGEFADLGIEKHEVGSGWVHAEVGEGNAGSEGVMRALGGKTQWKTGYVGFNLDKL